VISDLDDGQSVGISGTPAFFINGVALSGAQPFDSFKKIFELLLDNDTYNEVY